MRALLRQAGLPDCDWEERLVSSAATSGGRVLVDLPLAFEIAHDDARTLWHALTQLGPLRALMLARGAELIAQLGDAFVAELPAGPLLHTHRARVCS